MRTFEFVPGLGVVPSVKSELARVAEEAHALELLTRTSLEARGIVEHYVGKGLSGPALDRAVTRHARVIRVCDPDVVSGIPESLRPPVKR